MKLKALFILTWWIFSGVNAAGLEPREIAGHKYFLKELKKIKNETYQGPLRIASQGALGVHTEKERKLFLEQIKDFCRQLNTRVSNLEFEHRSLVAPFNPQEGSEQEVSDLAIQDPRKVRGENVFTAIENLTQSDQWTMKGILLDLERFILNFEEEILNQDEILDIY